MPAKTYAVISTKGGVGKTTVTSNCGAILADMNQRTLLIDGDPQQSLSRVLNLEYKAPFALTQLYKSANPESCISKTAIPNLDIVLNDDPGADNGAIATFLRESVTHFQHLYVAIQSIKDQYDYIWIDTQGAKGIIQESVIFAADVILSPVKPQVLDSREFIYGTVEMLNRFNPKPGFVSITGRPLPPLKVLVNMFDRTAVANNVLQYLRTEFDKESDAPISVLNTVIPDLQAYAESIGLGQPVHRFETSRSGSTQPALRTMQELIYELEPKLAGIVPDWTK